ncbi:MAG: YncE family protein [Ferruginibacter sp.]
MQKTIKCLLACMFVMLFSNCYAQTGLRLVKTLPVGGVGGWDYLAIGPVNDWLYVSHGTQVNILNKKTGDSIGVIENTTGVHGIAFDVVNSKGFTSNGKLNNVTVFDINTNKVLEQVPVGENPDAIIYESFSQKIITCNGRSKDLSIIDPVQNKLIGAVNVGGKPEAAVSDGAGMLYVNVEDKNEIVAVDTKTFKVLHHWSIAPGEEPTGLAFDAVNKRLFSGCDKLLIVTDAITGRKVAGIVIGEGCDGVAFDPATKNIYTSNGEGTLTVIHEDSPDKYSIIENVATKKSARTIALDSSSHLIYLPAADFEAAGPNKGERPKMKAGTFQILVMGK